MRELSDLGLVISATRHASPVEAIARERLIIEGDMSQPCPQLGIILCVARHASTASSAAAALRDDLFHLLEANGLSASTSSNQREYVISREGGQATDVDRQLLLEWSARWAQLASIAVSPVTDVSDDGD